MGHGRGEVGSGPGPQGGVHAVGPVHEAPVAREEVPRRAVGPQSVTAVEEKPERLARVLFGLGHEFGKAFQVHCLEARHGRREELRLPPRPEVRRPTLACAQGRRGTAAAAQADGARGQRPHGKLAPDTRNLVEGERKVLD